MSWLETLFGTTKPVIAMVHLPALPGTPLYAGKDGMDTVVEQVRQDLRCLQAGGVDAVMFCNENDRPYTFTAAPSVVAAMAYTVGRLRDEVSVPFGVDILWDPVASVALAHSVGAAFVREVFTGVYDSDMGLWQSRAAEALRLRAALGAAEAIRLLFNVSAEFAQPVSRRSVAELARSVAFSSLPDAICVSGPMTGEPVAIEDVERVVRAVATVGPTPVVVNTGVSHANVSDYLRRADGVIVGTALKVDGRTFNPVDQARVERFMAQVRQARAVSPV